jgi:hypothetical protein
MSEHSKSLIEPGDNDVRAPRRRRFRLQFSLATLMLFVTLVAWLVSQWTTSQKLKETTEKLQDATVELQKYRDELGYLTITDSNKVHAIGVLTPGSLKWQWRMYLPKNRQFKLHTICAGIPEDGVPTRGTSGMYGDIQSGEFLLDASVGKDQQARWVLKTCRDGRDDATISVSSWWIERDQWALTIEGVKPHKMESVAPGAPMVLLRLRAHQIEERKDGTWRSRAPDKPCDGVMIWIDEVTSQ